VNGTPPLGRRRILVTGAGSGIGQATVERLVGDGARVAMLDLQFTNEVDGEHRSGRPTPVRIVADVSIEASIQAGVMSAADQLGGLDGVVTCAGIQLFGRDSAAEDLALETWQRTIDVNLTGTFLSVKHAIPHLRAAGGGSIVCICSPTGARGSAPGFDAYSASKGGVAGLVRVLAADYAPANIRVNGLMPGFTFTPLVRSITEDSDIQNSVVSRIPLGRPGRPEEVASCVAFLLGDDASYVTASILVADGGFTGV